jgi:hypothetical protein
MSVDVGGRKGVGWDWLRFGVANSRTRRLYHRSSRWFGGDQGIKRVIEGVLQVFEEVVDGQLMDLRLSHVVDRW